MSKASPSQNSSVDTIWAPGIIRASVVFPAAPWPADPDQDDAGVAPRSCDQVEHRSYVHRRTVPSRAWRSCGSAAWHSRTGSSSTGPTAWGAAVRAPDGSIRAASGTKRRFAANVTTPFVRGPLRLAEAFAVLPDVRRALPEARFPFERPRVAAAVIVGAAAAGIARRSHARSPRPRGHRGARVARPGCSRPQRWRAGLLPRCRAHLDRHLRDRRGRQRRSTTAAAATSSARSC